MDTINLILTNTNSELQLTVPVQKLSTLCEYFKHLLVTYNTNQKRDVVINVINSNIARDVLLKLLGEKIIKPLNLNYLLDYYVCQNFFGINFDLDLLYNSSIDEIEFDLLLDIVNIIGCNYQIIRLLLDNLPKDYDLETLPKDLLIALYDVCTLYNIAFHTENLNDSFIYVKIIDSISGKIIRKHKCENLSFFNSLKTKKNTYIMCSDEVKYLHVKAISSDNKLLVTVDNDFNLKVWENSTMKLLVSLSGHNDYINHLCFSHDNKQLLSVSNDNTIKVWDIITGMMIVSLNYDNDDINDLNYNIWQAYFSPDDKQIISFGGVSGIKIWDIESGKNINTFEYGYNIQELCIIPDYPRTLIDKIKQSIT
ncbi:WD40 domain-containing protein [Cotonvirus japonicus]|uniref:WD40 domain-containing protein n=1 Tax=Cotonvirus japonicus TaxID=2811091 RepID=A0ABM7NTP6_9VIRU|nr:WD40 domain-containing protein [Cotonvirus japonicus]BCS83545.1 WD40 domain-containing protein [Cotonvirus japonicus]